MQQAILMIQLKIAIGSWGETTFDKAQKSINRHIIPKFGARDFTEITPKEWFDFFQGLQRGLNIYIHVEKLTSYCCNAYDWAKFQAKINFNPIDGMTKHLDKKDGGNCSCNTSYSSPIKTTNNHILSFQYSIYSSYTTTHSFSYFFFC